MGDTEKHRQPSSGPFSFLLYMVSCQLLSSATVKEQDQPQNEYDGKPSEIKGKNFYYLYLEM